ncbi:DUF2752 domain-containing protein [Micromonospora cathayae]|uniref:DUF2752 domain-containing protein n=1 Tax=Micromonospora cathayae TaxID=3028804 RepID=A0ABY8A0L2_9ACTN|nr:DUF2752 domain-containing protein [Micromonospora sp. HUAS 3]WDZ87534.1 DUF2752 domain-containing protein [Micromonospora sp. HUAS 3]
MTSVDGQAGPATPPTGSAPQPPPAAGPVGVDPYAAATGPGPAGPDPVASAGPAAPVAVGSAGPAGPGSGTAGPAGADPYASWPAGAVQVAEPDRFTRFVVGLYERAPRWAVPLAALGCVGAGVAYALVSDPTRAAPDALPSCLLKLTTGLDCPGCGGTRALWYVLHADLPAAARHHFLFVFALPFLAYLFVAWAANQAFGWKLPQLRISPKMIGGFLVAWLVFSVARNLPWAPFTSLYV